MDEQNKEPGEQEETALPENDRLTEEKEAEAPGTEEERETVSETDGDNGESDKEPEEETEEPEDTLPADSTLFHTDDRQTEEKQSQKKASNSAYMILIAVLSVIVLVLLVLVIVQAVNRNRDNGNNQTKDTTAAVTTTATQEQTDPNADFEITYIESQYPVSDTLTKLNQYAAYDYDLDALVTLGDITAIELDAAVTEEEVQAALQAALEAKAVTTPVTDETYQIQKGDTVNISFTGYVDGSEEPDPGCTGTKNDLVIGSGAMIAGFEDALVGAKLNETVTFDITFPHNYSTDLADKPARFSVKIESVSQTAVPELDETFVQENTDYNTVEEYTASVRKKLEEEKYKDLKSNIASYAWDKIVADAAVSAYPKEEYRNNYDYFVDYYLGYSSYYGFELSAFITSVMNSTMDAFYQAADTSAASTVKNDMVAMTIVRHENLTVTEEAYQAEINAVYNQYGFTSAAQFEEYYTRPVIEANMQTSMAIDLITSRTVIINQPANAADLDAELEAQQTAE